MKRTTVKIYERWLHAWDLHCVLSRAGVDSKLVARYAVQIAPGQKQAAKDAIRAEEAERKASCVQAGNEVS